MADKDSESLLSVLPNAKRVVQKSLIEIRSSVLCGSTEGNFLHESRKYVGVGRTFLCFSTCPYVTRPVALGSSCPAISSIFSDSPSPESSLEFAKLKHLALKVLKIETLGLKSLKLKHLASKVLKI